MALVYLGKCYFCAICPISSLSPACLVLHFVLLFCFLCCLVSCNPATLVVAQAYSILSCIPAAPTVVQACSTTSCIPATPVVAQDCSTTSLDFQLPLCHFLQIPVTTAQARFSPFTYSVHICIETITISRYDQFSTALLGVYLPIEKVDCIKKACQSVCGNLSHSVFLGVTRACSSIVILLAERFLCGSAGGKVLVSTCLARIYFERILLAGTAEQAASLLL